ncbi:MAG: 30S ribosome-binding factor RbfA [Gammaproteobacteria bacterium]|jgi:ribosome-binding factor A|nr:30S ribosome-binding factor RbfA [Gammaproteobacteria bacterium]
MPREFSRSRRVAELMQRGLAELIQRDLDDPRIGMVTITHVGVSKDYSHAEVYFSCAEGPEHGAEAEKQLNHAAGHLRTGLSKTINLRTTPKLHFRFDTDLERGSRMLETLEELARKRDQEEH